MSVIAKATLVGLVLAALPGAVSAAPRSAACVPEISFLPALEGHEWTRLYDLNSSGWAVGYSREAGVADLEASWHTAVLWRDGLVVDLGIGGGPRLEGVVDSRAIDVSEDGLVAAQRLRYRDRGLVGVSSWLWRDGSTTRLLGDGARKHAHVSSVNDHGYAVGSISRTLFGSGPSARPVVWKDAVPVRLPLRRGAAGEAWSINNNGLVTGWRMRKGSFPEPWYWWLDGGSGRLRLPTGLVFTASVADVDNRDRIVGGGRVEGKGMRGFLWRGPESRPVIMKGGRSLAGTMAINDEGDLTGSSGGFRGIGAGAWVSHLTRDRVKFLPNPPSEGGWANVYGTAVIRGVTPLSPQGGVTVGGFVEDFEDLQGGHATIWTCVLRPR